MRRPPPSDHVLLAPGAAGSTGTRARLPRVDDRLAPPETRVEYLRGVELFAAPADQPHATQHSDLAYVLHAHVTPPYRSAVDLLTRTGEASDFAPDASVFMPKAGGGRKLEELAFEVTDKQAIKVPTQKARELVRRGVRRVFALVVKHRRALEWSRSTDQWQPLPPSAVIEDRCLVRPLPVAALLDAAEGDEAVARALLARRIPVLEAALAEKREEGREEGLEEGREEGELRAAREAVREVFEARGLAISRALQQRLDACTDRAQLRAWHLRAVTAASAAEALREPANKTSSS